MTTERIQLSDGRVVDREVRPDVKRENVIARVVSLSPPTVAAFGGQWRIHARTAGLSVAVGDFVLVCRVEQGAIAVSKVELI